MKNLAIESTKLTMAGIIGSALTAGLQPIHKVGIIVCMLIIAELKYNPRQV